MALGSKFAESVKRFRSIKDFPEAAGGGINSENY
jgi:hypothetical protein